MSRSVDELEKLLGDVPWELFEGRYTGDIFIKLDKTLLGFFMRIGTYLKRPVQVIMADGNYIRIRSADKYAECGLRSLDPNKPEDCLYPEHYLYESGFADKPLWQPFQPYATAATQAQYVTSSTMPLGTLTLVGTSTPLGNLTTNNTGIVPTYAPNMLAQQATLTQQAQLQSNVGLFTSGMIQPNQTLGQSPGWFSRIFGGITP